MSFSELQADITFVLSIITFVGIVYGVVYWKATVDATLRRCKNCQDNYPPEETHRMVKTLWDIYVVGALQNKPDLAQHKSPYKLTQAGEQLIPSRIREFLDHVNLKTWESAEDIASGWLVVKHIGLDDIELVAKAMKLEIPETVAVLSLYLDERRKKYQGCEKPTAERSCRKDVATAGSQRDVTGGS